MSKTALIIGASRGLGYGMAAEYLRQGWQVVATKRGGSETKLDALARSSDGRLQVENLDIDHHGEILALHAKMMEQKFDLLFVNAGIMDEGAADIGDVTTEGFIRVMITNALSPMRILETFRDRVNSGGTLGVMSAGFGSVSNNLTGGFDAYRASKASLNTLMRSFFARYRNYDLTMVLMAPGWVRTDMGGADAALAVEECIPKLIETIEAQAGNRELQFLNYEGTQLPW